MSGDGADVGGDVATSEARAVAALRALEGAIDPAEPLSVALWRIVGELDGARPVEAMLGFLESRVAGSPRGESRYRWELTHRVGVKMPRYAAVVGQWTAWREGEAQALARDPFEVEARLLVPIVVTEHLEMLLGAAAGGELAARARALFDEAAPVARREIARYVAGTDAWADTFALWCLTRTRRVLEQLHSLAVALAVTHAAGQAGPVRGQRFPYYDKPLVSASAQLASALLALGVELEVASALVCHVGAARRASGGWGDDAEREDALTTVVAADLLARTDPSFDLAPTLAYFAATQGADGLWRALGPEAPWLSGEIVGVMRAAREPFAARFRWPHCARSALDHKTGVPFFAHFLDVANVMASLPGLATATIELAFLDLIGFRAFNNRFGQDAGDEVLRRFADELQAIAEARVVRDGGDEFLVIGTPGRAPLAPALDRFLVTWQAAFHARFGADVPGVAPRIVVGRSAGGALRGLRERLGRAITELKELAEVPARGVIRSVAAGA